MLLACRQWDPLGLARRLPSLGVGAWRSAPLLPWRVQCPVRVCAALAAGWGGPGRYLVLCPPRFPLPAPRVSRCVWRAVPSGCPLPSLAGTPFQAVCAFRELGPVALLVFPACPLCVCALALPRRPLPPPPSPGLCGARTSRGPGPFHAVRAPPRVLSRSLAPSGVLGGGRPGPVSPLPGLGLRAPRGVGLRARGVPVLGGGVGGGVGAACVPRPPFARPGGPVGRGVAPPRSVPLPSLGRQQSGCRWRRTGHGGRGPHTTPVRARLPSLGAARVVPWRVGAGALAPRGSCGSRRLGRGGGPCSGSPLGRRGPAGGRGDHSLCLGGVGAGVPAARGPAGGWGGGMGRAAAPLPSLWGAARGSLPRPPSRRRRIPPRRARSVGVAGPPRARGAACLAGGGGGWAREPLPRGPRQTQALPPPSPSGPHCSGSSPRAAPGRGPRVAPARSCGPARWPRPPREQAAGGAGARGVRVQLRPPGRVAVPSGGGGASPRFRGGGGSALLRPAGRGGSGGGAGGGGEGGAAPPLPAPLPRRVSACHPLSPARPPGVCSCCGGRRAAVGVGRGPVGRQWISAAGGGGGEGGCDLLALVRTPAFPMPASEWVAPFAPSWAPPSRGRSAAGNVGACGRFTGGAWRAAALAAAAVSPPLGAAASSWGCGAAVSPVGLRPLLGRGGGRGGGLRSPDAAPRRPRGGGLAVPAPWGQPSAGGAHSSPAPLHPVRAGPSCRPSLGSPAPPAVVARRWLAGGGREGQRSAVSGLRGSGLPLALAVPALPPTGGGARPSVALYRGGGVGWGARLSWGGRPAALSPPHSLAPVVWAVTCVAACVGVGAAAVAGSAGGSASG